MSTTCGMPDRDTMYDALVRKDASFEGVFIAAIQTTGIFCRPSCTARKPNPENVEYFPDAESAVSRGYRACKICSPLNVLGQTPVWLQPLIAEIEQDSTIQLRAEDLKQRGLDPKRVVRWFQKTYGLTFSAYLRRRRMDVACGKIRHRQLITDVALSSGYNSLSGFVDGFKKTVGSVPSKSEGNTVIATSRLLTPLGPMLAGATDQGICFLEFTEPDRLEKQINRLESKMRAKALPGDSSFFDELNEQLEAYFSGDRDEFDIPLVTSGTPFQERAWKALQKIPYGSTWSYAEQARSIGQPTAVRAVARANGDNRIAIIIPCHRVIGSNGKLTGYGGGLWRKKRLLEIENSLPEMK